MFKNARYQLTAWYLIISLFISLLFSGFIYLGVSQQLKRGLYQAELVCRARQIGLNLPPRLPRRLEKSFPQLQEVEPCSRVENAFRANKNQLIYRLLTVNLLVMVFSGLGGYFLSGKTLKPIQSMVKKQKRFIADASHELKTPLTALKTSMEVFLRSQKPKLKDSLKVIKSNLNEVNQLTKLSNQLLSLTYYQKNGSQLNKTIFDLKPTVLKVYEKLKPLALKKSQTVTLPQKSLKIKADQEAIKKMLTIFIDNAIKYCPKRGKIKIRLKTLKNQAVITISDTGIGIALEEIPRIFDRFYRGDQARQKTSTSGFGLGLTLAKQIVNLHKGEIKVKSQPQKGATFLIYLPLK